MPCMVASGATEKQGPCQVCGARRKYPKTLSRTADANLDRAFVENALFYVVPKLGEGKAPFVCV